MFNAISQILLYILFLYVFYLLGLGISRLWLIIRILFFVLLFGYVGQAWENIDYFDVGSFFGFIVPLFCISWPSIARTFNLYNLSFNPFGFLGWLRDRAYTMKRRRQEREAEKERIAWDREQESRRRAEEEQSSARDQGEAQAHQQRAERERLERENARRRAEEHRRQEEAHRQRQEAERKREEDPYEVLGVTRDMSKAEIRKAYLDLMQKYAPDKVNHLAPEFQKMAHEKCVKFNWAWEEIRKD